MILLPNYPVFSRDTLYSIRERIAAERDTVPKFLIILPPHNLEDWKTAKRADIRVVDFKFLFQRAIERAKTFSSILSEDEDLLPIIIENNISDPLAKLWASLMFESLISSRQQLSRENLEQLIETEYEGAQDAMQALSEMKYLLKSLPDPFENDLKAFLSTFDRDIKANQIKVSKFLKQIQELQETSSASTQPIEKYSIVSYDYQVVLGLQNYTIYEIFDAIILTKDIPFAYVNSYYKVLKDYMPSSLWFEQPPATDDIIRLRLSNDQGATFQEILMSYRVLNKTDEKKKFVLDFEVKGEISVDLILAKIMQVFPSLKATIESKSARHINALFNVPDYKFDKYTFSHIILNDKMFSDALYVDERRGASTRANVLSLYVNFVINDEDVLSAYLTPQEDKSLRFKVVRAKSEDDIKSFQRLMGVLLPIYDVERKNIEQLYTNLLTTEEEEEGGEEEEAEGMEEESQKRLKDIAPDVFTTGKYGYVRKCQPKERLPKIISEDETSAYLSTMVFPKSSAEGKQHVYGCNHPDYPYVGLSVYKNNKYGFLPCCYVNKQQGEARSKYEQYMAGKRGEDVKKSMALTKQQHLISTNKFLDHRIVGTLEAFPRVNKMMNLFLKNPSDTFLRVGVDRSKKSFLLSVALALNVPNLTTKERRLNFVRNTLLKLSKDENILACARQENPDKTTQEIGMMISNPDTYLSPRLFYRILEEFFHCKIYFFTGDTLGIPNHQKNYLIHHHDEGKENVVLILEHLGSESDLMKTDMFPQCELVVLGNKTTKAQTKTSFSHSEDLKNLQVIFQRMTKSFFKGKLQGICEQVLLPRSSSIKGQIINAFGKTVAVVVTPNSTVLYLPSPIAPLNVKEMLLQNLSKTSLRDVLEMFPSDQGYEILKCVFKNSLMVYTLQVKQNSKILFYVPIIPLAKSEVRLPSVVSTFVVPDQKDLSGFEVFSANEKLTWYITQYILYLFSLYVFESKTEVLSEELIKNFLDTHTVVDEERITVIGRRMLQNENPFGKNFNLTSSNPLMKNSRKIAIPKGTTDKLEYMIKLRLNTDLHEVVEFYKRNSIDTFIKDVYDFQINPNQVLLSNISSLLKYIEEFDRSFIVSHKVKLSEQEPYFFRNSILGPDVYFANNFKDKTKALNTLNNWQTYSVNSSNDLGLSLDENFIAVYGYSNENDIRLLEGDEDFDDVALLGYRINESHPIQYTTLLNCK